MKRTLQNTMHAPVDLVLVSCKKSELKKYTVLLLFSLSTLHLSSQGFDVQMMDSLFARIEQHEQGMGSISLFKDGEEIYQNSIGYADIQNQIAAGAHTKYRIGSISKSFTAAIIMQLIDEGKLTLSSPLADYFPNLPNANEITIEHLLRHRSGLYNFTNAADYPKWMEQSRSKAELLELFKEKGAVFSPDEKAEYSNTNYVLLSYIAEMADGKTYRELLSTRITTPLKLNNTYFGGKIAPAEQEALSYNRLDGQWELATQTDMSIPMGAGAIVSTPNDLNRFYHALFAGKVVSVNALKEMTKLVEGFGIGLFPMPFYEKLSYGHAGGIDGFQSMAMYFQDENLNVSYTSNATKMPVNNVLIGVLSIYFGRTYELPAFTPPLTLDSAELEQYLGVYSSPAFPLKITISREGNQLIGQATGQPTFPLEPYAMNKFRFEPAMLQIEFRPTADQLILKQGAAEFELTRE